MNTFKTIIASIAFVLISCKGKDAAILPADLQGHWQCLLGEYEFVEFLVDGDEYILYGSFGQRLTILGNWELKGNTLIVLNNNNEIEQYSLDFRGDTLLFDKGKQKFIRVASSEELSKTNSSEMQPMDLLLLIVHNTSYNFSAVGLINEGWLPPALNWQMISTPVIFNDDFSELSNAQNSVIEILNSQGFVAAEDYVTEIISGYKQGNTVVILRPIIPSEPNRGDTLTLEVICGILN
jgi:hypothetical protein